MKIGVAGCSHSSHIVGNPWHYYMGLKLNAEIIESSSPGAGNEMNFEKVKYILEKNNDLDFFVFQVTEPSRFVIGLDNSNTTVDNLNSSNLFNSVYYYTFNKYSNNDNLLNLLNKKYVVDDFIINNVITSDYNQKIKVFHTLLGIKNLCDIFNVKVIFFSWFVDLYKLAKLSGYDDIIKSMNIIPRCVNDIVVENNIKCLINQVELFKNSHFDSKNSERIYNEYLHNNILKITNKLQITNYGSII